MRCNFIILWSLTTAVNRFSPFHLALVQYNCTQVVLTRSEPAGSPYVPSCSLQPDSGRFFDGRIPVCSGAFQPVPTGNSSEFVHRKTGRNPAARNMTEHAGTGRFRSVPARIRPVPAIGMIDLGYLA